MPRRRPARPRPRPVVAPSLRDRLGILHVTGAGADSLAATTQALAGGCRLFRVTAVHDLDAHLAPMLAASATIYRSVPRGLTVAGMDAEVRRLAGRAAVFGLGNEPKATQDPLALAAEYAALADRVALLDPGGRMGGIDVQAHLLADCPDWLARFREAPARPFARMGVFALHVIPPRVGSAAAIIAQAGAALAAVRALGWTGATWLTEVGAGSDELGESGQASFLGTVLPACLALGYGSVLWAFLRDLPLSAGYGYRSNGLFRADAGQTPKPAWSAFATLVKE